jgi:peptidoglycan/xylan/chitin deacetylase (PgdA/CDA1 family)
MGRRLKSLLLGCPGFEALCRALTRDHVRVFMYHRFSRDGAESRSHLPGKAELSDQMRRVAANHDVLSPSGHLAFLQGDAAASCPVVVTIDDGYADFHEIAYPVFRDLEIPAMLFVCTGFIDGETWFWWDRIRHVLASAAGRRDRFEHDGASFDLDLTRPEGRESAWHRLADHCRFVSDPWKEDLIRALADRLEVAIPAGPPPDMAPLDWDRIREMERHGILFGSHTVTHPILTRVPPEEAEWEMARSRDRLAEEIETPVDWFCYPQGGPADVDPRLTDMASRLFAGAYVAYCRDSGTPEPHALPRYGTSADPVAFRWNLCGAAHLVQRIKRRMGRTDEVAPAYWNGSEERTHVG